MSVREIKFRAWDKLGKRMGNVNYIKYSDVKYTHISVRFKQKEKNIDDWFNYGGKDGCDNIILMQFTGLYDKDGKEIYEGDIVTGLFDHTEIIGHIIYGSDATFFIYRKGLFGIGLNNAKDWLEVIGNIYESPELLKE